MTKEELIANQKRAGRLLWWLLGIMFLIMIGLAHLIHATGAAHRDLAFRIALFVIIAAIFGGIFWIGKKTDVRCPACKKSVQGGIYAPLAIATGKCGHCGATLFDEPPTPETTSAARPA